MTSSIFIRTYTNDLPWFRWAFASICKFWAEESKILISCEPDDVAAVQATVDEYKDSRNVQIQAWKQWGASKGYIFQIWQKMVADTLVDSEIIVYFDSDLLLNRVCSLEDFLDPSKKLIRVFYEPYSSVLTSEHQAAGWQVPTWKAMQVKPDWEFMRRHAFVFHRDTIRGCREYLENLHGPLHEWLLSIGNGTEMVFSEFNCLGFYAWLHHTDRYWFLNVKEYEKVAGSKYGVHAFGENPVEQFHSWTGDPEQSHQRFLQCCERADYLVEQAKLRQAQTEQLAQLESLDRVVTAAEANAHQQFISPEKEKEICDRVRLERAQSSVADSLVPEQLYSSEYRGTTEQTSETVSDERETKEEKPKAGMTPAQAYVAAIVAAQ